MGEHTSSQQLPASAEQQPVWYVMRDLKRWNAKMPAYRFLQDAGFDVFTPMKTELTTIRGVTTRREHPVLMDLLFVRSTPERLAPIVDVTPTLQFRYVKGGWKIPMTVSDREMQRFIAAVRSTPNPKYYAPSEIKPEMIGKRVIIRGGGILDGFEATLRKVRGTRKRRIFVSLANILTVEVEINPDFLEVID